MATATIFDFLLTQQRDAGNALVNGTVTFYAAGTTSLKAVWSDSIAATEAPNPYTLDSRAAAVVYGIGNYKIVLKNSSGVTVATWDNVYVGADLSSIDLSSVIAAASFSNRDFIGNSRFNIWNNGTTFNISTTADTVTADGWYYRANGSTAGTVVVSRQSFTYGQTEVDGNPLYFSRIARSGASTGATSETYAFRMPIETASGEEMTFRFNAKAAGATNVTVSCIQNFGSGGSATVTTTSASIGITTAWQRLYKTFTVPSITGKTVGSGAYVEVGISFTPNTTYTVDIAQCKFETGTVAGADEPRTSYEDDIRTSGTIATRDNVTLADTNGDTDEKYWRMEMDYTANTFKLIALDDAQSSGESAFTATRDGATIASVELPALLDQELVGIPTAPTAAADTNTTQISTTAFAKKEADDAQAYAIQRANHTGTQSQSTVVDLVSDLAAKMPASYLDTDGTLAANSDTKIASQKAVKTYVTATAFSTALPDQTGNSGKVPTTDGTNASWTELKTVNSTSLLGSGDVAIPAQSDSSRTYTGPKYTRDDDGTISGGTWAIDYNNGPVIKATAGANITSITMSNWPASGTGGHLRCMLVNFGAYTITFPTAWKWIKADLTTTTTFGDLGLTLPSSGTAIVDLFSDDGGTTIYAKVLR